MVMRLVIASVLLLAGAGYIAHASTAEVTVPRQSLRQLPLRFDRWQGRDDAALSAEILAVLGVDEYVSRTYGSPREPGLNLYVGFYASQRQGDTMHSPLNCMPGAGWQPVKQDRATYDVPLADGSRQAITVNQFVIQKGLDRQMVQYWYQSHGRVVASEYTSKAYMIYDAIRLNRTDAAMIRVITPIVGETPADETAAARRATEFVQGFFPQLGSVLPS